MANRRTTRLWTVLVVAAVGPACNSNESKPSRGDLDAHVLEGGAGVVAAGTGTGSLAMRGGTGSGATTFGGAASIAGAPNSNAGGGQTGMGGSGQEGGIGPSGGASAEGGRAVAGTVSPAGMGGAVAQTGAAGAAGAASAAGAAGAGEIQLLSQTGLYESDMKTIRSDVMPYTPRFELWSDGAAKKRWLYLPVGTTIDTSDPDYWRFPVGTKVWKEFAKNGRRIETRIIERSSSRNYRMIAYLWREDQSDAVALGNGQPNAMGTDHDVPSSTDCETCHSHQPGRIASVGAIQLDYDYAGLTVAKLQAQGRLSVAVPNAKQLPGDATAQAAIGMLHANCGICHNPNSALPYKALDLWQRVSMLGSVTATPAYQSAVGIPTGANPDGNTPAILIVAGHPESSALVHRMNSRTTDVQMPPLASKIADSAAIKTVSDFITALE